MKTLIIFLVFLILISQLHCIEIDLSHQITSTFFVPLELNELYTKFNYRPELITEIYSNKQQLIDSELSYSFDLDYEYKNSLDTSSSLYRSWLRYSNARTEFRFGLQKINFGPARILRSLQWFDNINPFDPTRSTEGVKAILNRTYFDNNANLWLWGIWGRSSSIENFFKANDPEFGGRLQYPFKYCEAAVSYNWKETEFSENRENRIAFDARWDNVIGFWTEYYISHFSNNQFEFSSNLTLGADYTFAIGNGIYFLAEILRYSQMPEVLFKETTSYSNAAVSISYPLGLFDQLSSIIFMDIDQKEIYSSFTYQYTMNYLTIYLNLMLSEEGIDTLRRNKLELILQWNY